LVSRCFIRRRDRKLLILRRALTDNNAGKWECAGGKLDEGQDLMHAREREVMEETGLLTSPIHSLVFAESYVIGSGKYKGMPYVALFNIDRVIGGKLKLSEEHVAYAWVTYDEMMTYDLTDQVRKAAIILKKYLT
jgi:8-oxo-dGTP diphosphatase